MVGPGPSEAVGPGPSQNKNPVQEGQNKKRGLLSINSNPQEIMCMVHTVRVV